MKITPLGLDGLLRIEPERIGDHRGYFCETFRADKFAAAAGPVIFVQDNQSLSAQKGTVRGLHYQRPVHAQAKLVRVLQGEIVDVAVDIRRGSKTFGQHVAVTLSADNGHQLYIPVGFLHGFCTLVENCIISYKVSDYYSAQHDGAVRWDDPQIGIQWPVAASEALLSDKDRRAPLLSQIEPF